MQKLYFHFVLEIWQEHFSKYATNKEMANTCTSLYALTATDIILCLSYLCACVESLNWKESCPGPMNVTISRQKINLIFYLNLLVALLSGQNNWLLQCGGVV